MVLRLSRLDFSPTHPSTKTEECQNWMTFTKCWCAVEYSHNNSISNHEDSITQVFANCGDEKEIYPLTVKEIAEAQKKDKAMKQLKISEKYEILLIENLQVLCKDGKLVIPKSLQHHAVSWYHHYLQHPGHSRLEETMRAAMYWKGMRTTIRSYVKKCRSCQTNKR